MGIIDEAIRPPPSELLAGKGACASSCLKKDTHTIYITTMSFNAKLCKDLTEGQTQILRFHYVI